MPPKTLSPEAVVQLALKRLGKAGTVIRDNFTRSVATWVSTSKKYGKSKASLEDVENAFKKAFASSQAWLEVVQSQLADQDIVISKESILSIAWNILGSTASVDQEDFNALFNYEPNRGVRFLLAAGVEVKGEEEKKDEGPRGIKRAAEEDIDADLVNEGLRRRRQKAEIAPGPADGPMNLDQTFKEEPMMEADAHPAQGFLQAAVDAARVVKDEFFGAIMGALGVQEEAPEVSTEVKKIPVKKETKSKKTGMKIEKKPIILKSEPILEQDEQIAEGPMMVKSSTSQRPLPTGRTTIEIAREEARQQVEDKMVQQGMRRPPRPRFEAMAVDVEQRQGDTQTENLSTVPLPTVDGGSVAAPVGDTPSILQPGVIQTTFSPGALVPPSRQHKSKPTFADVPRSRPVPPSTSAPPDYAPSSRSRPSMIVNPTDMLIGDANSTYLTNGANGSQMGNNDIFAARAKRLEVKRPPTDDLWWLKNPLKIDTLDKQMAIAARNASEINTENLDRQRKLAERELSRFPRYRLYASNDHGSQDVLSHRFS